MWSRVRRLVTLFQWILAASLPVITAMQKAFDPATMQGEIRRILVGALHAHFVTLVLGISVLGVVLKGIEAGLDRWATQQGAIKAVLDSAHKVYFEDVPEDARYLHRVTLFKARRHLRDLGFLNSDGWKRRLRVFARSGTAYQQSKTLFRVDDENEEQNEGIAGRAWFINAQCTVCDLPEWPNGSTAGADPGVGEARSTYARKSYLSADKAGRLNVKSRSIGAHVVRHRTGDRWGVLVFDSKEPNGLSDRPEKVALMRLTSVLLQELV